MNVFSKIALKDFSVTCKSSFPSRFIGQECDNELAGVGNFNKALYWEYDTRLGRRWNVDPKPNPFIGNYSTFFNNPILYSDLLDDSVKFKKPADFGDILSNSIASSDFAQKFNDLRKSKNNYYFEKVEYSPDNGIKGGRTSENVDNPSDVDVFYAMGDNPLKKDLGRGLGPNNSLWEETFHAWDHSQGGLDLNNNTAFDEAEAWQFSSKAPGTKFEFENFIPEDNRTYRDKTAMFRIANSSTTKVAQWLHDGMPSYYDKSTKTGYSGLGRYYKDKKLHGLYEELPLGK